MVALLLVWFQHVVYTHDHIPDETSSAHGSHLVSLWDYDVPTPPATHDDHDHEDAPEHRTCQFCLSATSDDEDDLLPGGTDLALPPETVLVRRVVRLSVSDRCAQTALPSAARRSFEARAPPSRA